MWNVPDERALNGIPRLYETEGTPVKEKIIHLHFFIGGCDWFIAEYDGEDTLFGFVILNGDYLNAEWGYVSFEDLKSINIHGLEIDRDLHWKKRKACEVAQIAKARGWYKSA